MSEEEIQEQEKSNKNIEYFYDRGSQRIRYRYLSSWTKSFTRHQFEKCEEMGEAEVRSQISHWSERRRKVSENWLELQEFKRESERLERAEEREEESLSISRKALRISESAVLSSERATRIAISAITLSIIMAIYEIMNYYQII